MFRIIFFIFVAIIFCSFSSASQIEVWGEVSDSLRNRPLPYVNIGIREKNLGTASKTDGSFKLSIPAEFIHDTLTFSMVGYEEFLVPIASIKAGYPLTIRLREVITLLKEIQISGEKLVERKFGIKRRGVIHFTDGIFNKDDSFEIGQVIDLGNELVQVTSLNLHLNVSRPDSASFRLNFYRYDENDNRPADRIVHRNILQRHPIKEGWLRFDLTAENILVQGKVFASIEFIPEGKNDIKQIYYEVKIGGMSKSFYRKNSLGTWNVPPHHYCLFVTARVDKHKPEEPDDVETPPTTILRSPWHTEAFSIYISLPKGYRKKNSRRYPVVYHLDGNAYFDPVCASVDRLIKKNKIKREPIVVGIGYENAYLMDSLRNRDYTFPQAAQADSFSTSGGGERFYQFITTTLNPYIENTYNIDTTSRTIMGHSLGGYFVLYAFLKYLNGQPLFNNFVAASPSISYFDDYILKQLSRISTSEFSTVKPKLYLTIGEIEMAEDVTLTFSRFGGLLARDPFIQLNIRVYKNMEHMGTAVPSFEDGIEFVLRE